MMHIDGIPLLNYVDKILDIRRQIIAPISASSVEVPGLPGALTESVKLDPRTIEVDIYFKSSGFIEMRQRAEALAAFLFSGKQDRTITFDDEPNRTYYGFLQGSTDLTEIIYHGTATLQFLCNDPLKYGLTKIFNFDMDLGQASVNVSCSYSVEPIITLNISGSKTNMEVSCNGKKITLNRNFSNGDQVVLDCSTDKVTVNGTIINTSVTPDSRYFSLSVGSNLITLTDKTNISSGTVEFVERWL